MIFCLSQVPQELTMEKEGEQHFTLDIPRLCDEFKERREYILSAKEVLLRGLQKMTLISFICSVRGQTQKVNLI